MIDTENEAILELQHIRNCDEFVDSNLHCYNEN
jgi:hypothetical protein